ncbi:macro domain protein [Peptoanaerobacter stomatis]|uniref:Macro domain protein n=1 Tax=Peptoanaerobacter stomatis TaxID=796937 RepID=J5WI98_9FIRM|nr:O-acetyl-ADP-ribose deacetylase [Peptoanaerobacter stomatis]EJU22122.1 macro domain protein [Peptoanaerobacter stomatis]NWO24874.1 O-acetyl-ADP-ribose deacetylase [Peptostreptococcaceae bacterium oral taxon 081]
MPLEIIRADITKLEVDAIVNAANSSLLGGGGVDGAIHKAAGKELLEECRKLNGCNTGMAKITKGYNLPAKYIIHTVGPIYRGGNNNEKQELTNCYKNSLKLAKEHKINSIAFPIISSGAYGYPKDKAIEVATFAISSFLEENDMMIYLVVYDTLSFKISEDLFKDIKAYIDDNYVDSNSNFNINRGFGLIGGAGAGIAPGFSTKIFIGTPNNKSDRKISKEDSIMEMPLPLEKKSTQKSTRTSYTQSSLEDRIENLEDTFSQRLLKLIDEKGKTDVEIYKKANIDRKLFSKIRSDIHYKPKKITVLAFALALELSIDETKDFLQTCGYALSRSSRFDVIVEYFIRKNNYNVFEINNALFKFEEQTIGA